MVYLHSSISVCNSVDHTLAPIMANSLNSSDSHPKARNGRKSHTSPSSSCPEFSRSAAIDVVILIAVITACVFLFFPCIKFVTVKSVQLLVELSCLARGEISRNPVVYGSIALSITCAAISAWVVLLLCTSKRCRNPNCRGLKKAAEFDIQIEKEDRVKNSTSGVSKRGLFQVPRDHHRELEAELKKMAPPNGRAVLVLRARCGCSVGRLEVPGPKKQQRKIKK
ncbi:PREDICTED: uncharacterized protein At5g19025-like [Tarenaya hassleriana]|uniref:uncharacterized protein At5g19025-like n=1 Tax=Tarenaya hassleriana TaxID=28532 RepID=UPI00053C28CD|nr:PREDICTED: uncharacterized protein At5g19025-like [Tarenaya hassleriana]XP_010551851.1 PREDICTED: uncharacterized protein At5g19025-like [Tarenaya hassleriana]XP_010551852.1 PREDICTED: uncharacterized protein At5g19025-like [Tarenaya hassleriana]